MDSPAPATSGSDTEEVRALEEALSALDFRVDARAYRDLPVDWLLTDLRRLSDAVKRVGLRNRIRSTAYTLINDWATVSRSGAQDAVTRVFPRTLEFRGPTTVIPPITLAPDPRRVVEWLSARAGVATSYPAWGAPISAWVTPWSRSACGIYFEPGPATINHALPLYPRPKGGAGWPMSSAFPTADFGRLIWMPTERHDDLARSFGLDGAAGGREIRTVVTVQLNSAVWIRDTKRPGSPSERDVTVAFMDANGAVRNEVLKGQGMGHCMDNHVRWDIAGVPDASKAEARVPSPFEVAPAELPVCAPPAPSEQFVLDEAVASASHGIVIVRADKGWKPFMEDVVLDSRAEFRGDSPDEVRAIIVFSSAADEAIERLVRAMAATVPAKAGSPSP